MAIFKQLYPYLSCYDPGSEWPNGLASTAAAARVRHDCEPKPQRVKSASYTIGASRYPLQRVVVAERSVRPVVLHPYQIIVNEKLCLRQCLQKLIRRAVIMIENVMQDQCRAHIDRVLEADQMVAVAIESERPPLPVDDRAHLPVRIPRFWAWTHLAVVPAGGSVCEGGTTKIGIEEHINTGIWRLARGRDGTAEPTDRA